MKKHLTLRVPLKIYDERIQVQNACNRILDVSNMRTPYKSVIQLIGDACEDSGGTQAKCEKV